MKIKKFKGKNIHGFLDFDINFKDGLNFLIGKNGCGKTTILKLLSALITPSFPELFEIEFSSIVIEGVSEDKAIGDITIKANKKVSSGDNIKLELNILGGQTFRNNISFKNFRDFNYIKVVKEISKLRSPAFLSLNRKLFTGELADFRNRKLLDLDKYERLLLRDEYFYQKKYSKVYERKEDNNLNVLGVEELINNYVKKISEEQPKLIEDFKLKVLSDSVGYSDEVYSDSLKKLKDFKVKNLRKKKNKLDRVIQDLDIPELGEKVDIFFEKLEKDFEEYEKYRRVDENYEKEELEVLLKILANYPQINRIDKIIEASKEYLNKLEELNKPINNLNKILDDFFKQTQTKVEIQTNGDIQVIINNKRKSFTRALSSGEKQILIMITHLIFKETEENSSIFIIDEPELSLHLAWQEIFAKSIKEASPNTQFILATHSPDIVGKFQNFVIKVGE